LPVHIDIYPHSEERKLNIKAKAFTPSYKKQIATTKKSDHFRDLMVE
jgi:hypothetical protein